jgi:tight adherence protein B
MTGFALGVTFASGIALIWLGAVVGARTTSREGRARRLLAEAGLSLHPALFLVAAIGLAALAGMVAWSLAGVPILAVLAACGGAYAPFAWSGARRERFRRERERAWPAALAQLADALEAGLAFPAAVALAAEAGPAPLRCDLAAFHARLRSSGLASAVDGLAGAGERTADTVASLLRAGLLDLPAGGLAPVLRELAAVLSERFEAREKARSRAATLRLEAAILALSPIVLLLLIGAASPA